jgi:hypothetical protein
MASLSQIKVQLAANVKFTGGEAIPPPPPVVDTGEAPLVILQGAIVDGTDYGDIRVGDGKMVFDMDHFSPDYGLFDTVG